MKKIEDFIKDGYHYTMPYIEVFDAIMDNVFETFIVLDLSTPTFEIPYCFSSIVRYALNKNKDYVVIPFSSILSQYIWRKTTTVGVLSELVKGFNRGRIIASKLPSGELYYGLPGVVFNQHKQLLLSTNSIFKYKEDNLVLLENVVRVSPEVYRNDAAIEKNIVKKLIPKACEIGTKVIIDNYSITTNSVKPRIKAQEECNKILRKHIDEIWD